MYDAPILQLKITTKLLVTLVIIKVYSEENKLKMV